MIFALSLTLSHSSVPSDVLSILCFAITGNIIGMHFSVDGCISIPLKIVKMDSHVGLFTLKNEYLKEALFTMCVLPTCCLWKVLSSLVYVK